MADKRKWEVYFGFYFQETEPVVVKAKTKHKALSKGYKKMQKEPYFDKCKNALFVCIREYGKGHGSASYHYIKKESK